ncbi:hypothetical protein KC333_g5 [Hortaea werneckii]|nr:hypothetical protein KC333_g5 [Hortaea werneckii]
MAANEEDMLALCVIDRLAKHRADLEVRTVLRFTGINEVEEIIRLPRPAFARDLLSATNPFHLIVEYIAVTIDQYHHKWITLLATSYLLVPRLYWSMSTV